MASKTRAQIRDFARTLLSEPTASWWSDSEINTYINDGLEDFCLQTDCLEDISTDSLIAYQADYTLPTDYTKIKQVELVKGNSIYYLYPEDLQESYTGIVKTTNNPPQTYNLWEDKLRLGTRPTTAAASTTLTAAISSTTATTASLTSVSGFPRVGRVLIDSEVIGYWYISTLDLTVCQRGLEGTTAATHSNGATVTLRDIYIYHFKKETLSSDSNTPTIPTQFHEAPAWYAASIGRYKSKDYDLAAQNKSNYDEMVVKGINYAKERWKRVYHPK